MGKATTKGKLLKVTISTDPPPIFYEPLEKSARKWFKDLPLFTGA